MNIATNCKNYRKNMVYCLANHIGVKAAYMGMPTGSYRLDDITVDRDAMINGSSERLKQIIPFLMEQGYISELPHWAADCDEIEAARETDSLATSVEENTEENMEDNTQEAGQGDSGALIENAESEEAELDEQRITQLGVSIPIAEFNALGLINFLKLIYSRQSLITAMTSDNSIAIDEELMDLLSDEMPDSVERICELLKDEIRVGMVRGIDIEDDRITIAFPYDAADPTRWKHYSALMLAIADRAKNARHISGKRLDLKADEGKYYCRNWLIRLGLGGTDYRETQRVLLKHLRGYAAFKSVEKMDAHKAKYASLRQSLRKESET